MANTFKIIKTEKQYRVTCYDFKDEIEVEYIFPQYGKVKFVGIHKGEELLNNWSGKSIEKKDIGNEKEFLEEVGLSFYEMIRYRFKVKNNYTLTHDNKSNGKGLHLMFIESLPFIYSGDFKDETFHGKGLVTKTNGTSSGSFKNGQRHGHFYEDMEGDYKASGKYIDGIQDGIWKVQKFSGATFEMVFEKGRKVSTTATNKGIENEKVKKHVANAEFQLKSVDETLDNIVNIANNCATKSDNQDDFTLRDYQYCIEPIANNLGFIQVAFVAADKELTKARREAKECRCENTLQILKNAQEDLQIANGHLGRAKKAFRSLHNVKTRSSSDSFFNTGNTAYKRGGEAYNEYKFWMATIDEEVLMQNKCYKYSTTDNSTLPSKTSSENKATIKNSSSNFSQKKITPPKKTTSQNKTATKSSSPTRSTPTKKTNPVASTPVVYPTFTGKYEGNNLLLLMGRKIDDPAVQKLLNDPSYEFERKDNSGNNIEKIDYDCFPYRFSLTFINGRMTYIFFEIKEWDKDHYFKKKLPLNIPLAKSMSAMKRMKDKWEHNIYGGSPNWKLKKYQLRFDVWGGGANNDINMVNINAEDIKDWNSYYRQFQ